MLEAIRIFIALKPRFFCRNLVLGKMPAFMPVFWFHLLGKDGAHCCFTTRTEQTSLKPRVFSRNLVFVEKQQKSSCFWVVKTKTLIGHIAFFVPRMVLFEKQQKGDVSKTLFSEGFEVFTFHLLTLYFFFWLVVF